MRSNLYTEFLKNCSVYAQIRPSFESYRKIIAKQEEVCDAVSARKKKEQENWSRLVKVEEELLHVQAEALPSPETSRNAFLFTGCPDQNVLRREVNSLMERYEGITGVFTGTDGEGYRFVLGSRNIDMKAMLPGLRARGFKCGGGKEQVQGSATLTEAEIRSLFSGEI